jgi:hypothetical protein
VRNLHKLKSPAPYINDLNQNWSKEWVETHTWSQSQQQHAHKSKREDKNQNNGVTAQERAQISIQWIDIVIADSRSYRMLKVCLCSAPWRLRGPFIAPRDLGAVGASFGRPWLPSIRGYTGLSGAHRTLHSATTTDRWLTSFRFWRAPERPVGGAGLSGAPADCWLQLACQVAVGRLAHRTVRRSTRFVRWIIVNKVCFSREWPVWPDCAPNCPVHTGLSGGWHGTVRCYAD